MSSSEKNGTHKSDDHIFVEPEVATHPRRIKKAGGYPPTRAPHIEDEGARQTQEKGIKSRLEYVVADTRKKELRDEIAYFVIDFNIKGDHPSSTKLLERLHSKLLTFLDKEKTRALVGSKIETLDQTAKSKKEIPKSLAKIVFDIRPIKIEEQIDKDILDDERWATESKDVDIYVVPNIDIEKITQYINQIAAFLKESRSEVRGMLVDEFSRSGMLSVKINFPTTSELLKKSSFVYRVHETPKLRMQGVTSKVPSQRNMRNTESRKPVKKGTLTSHTINLPEVCVIDTGVNHIPPLAALISQRSSEPNMLGVNDQDDHGTSVAYLVAFGEKNSARARIISYKIHSGSISSSLFRALANAITQFLPKTRIFTCSINFLQDNDASRFETWKIDRLVQASNSCVLFSTGNILSRAIRMFMARGITYPRYLDHSPVLHPSDATSIVSVGSYCKKSKPMSIGQCDSPSPFTRYDTGNSLLWDCVKPEIVEHGGNLDTNFSCQGVGVKTFSATGSSVEKAGTSFSTPIVAGHLAEIEKKYRGKIRNAETLKALAYSSCEGTQYHPKFVGFGKPDCEDMLASPFQSAKVIFEGNLRLVIPNVKEWLPAHEISVYVPAKVDKIELCLVHSDNYDIPSFLGLHTFIEVMPEKPARESAPPPDQGDLRGREHVKRLAWHYQKAVRGYWTFKLVPHHIGVPVAFRRNVTLRYGGVIKLTTTHHRDFSLTSEVRRHLKGKMR